MTNKMTYAISYEEKPEYFLIETQGEFDIEDFNALAAELMAHPCWKPAIACLFDYRNTQFIRVRPEDLEKARVLHKANDSRIGKGRSALVMKDTGNYGVGRMYQGSTEFHVQTEFKIFTDIEEARSWVGVTPDVSAN